MKIPFVDLASQYASLKSEIDDAIAAVIADSAFVGTGTNPHILAFEEAFAHFTGAKHCIACANGTESLELALRALKIGFGDEVIVPAQSWISTAEVVSLVGARIRFVDTVGSTQNIDPTQIEAAITPRTRAIMVVHLQGRPADLDAILPLAEAHGLAVIEDCAQAHGATSHGRHVGTFGTFGSFSFFPGKNLGAYGDAGGLVTDDDALAATVRRLVNHGRLGRSDHTIEGKNARMDGLQAAILSAKLPHLQGWVDARRAHAETYRRGLEETDLILPGDPAEGRHAYHLFVVQTPHRDALREALEEAGIPTGIHYPKALPFLPCYRHYGATPAAFPISHTQPDHLLSLPIYPELRESDIAMICSIIVGTLGPVSASR